MITAWNIMQLKGINPAKIINKDIESGIDMVLKGEADAMFSVSAKPADAFKNKFNSSDVAVIESLKKVHFVPLDNKGVLKNYISTDLSSDDYSGIKDTKTIAVKSILISFDFYNTEGKSKVSKLYYEKRCKQLRVMANTIRKNFCKFKSGSYTRDDNKWMNKWKEIDLDEKIDGWELDKCSQVEKKIPDYGCVGKGGKNCYGF